MLFKIPIHYVASHLITCHMHINGNSGTCVMGGSHLMLGHSVWHKFSQLRFFHFKCEREVTNVLFIESKSYN